MGSSNPKTTRYFRSHYKQATQHQLSSTCFTTTTVYDVDVRLMMCLVWWFCMSVLALWLCLILTLVHAAMPCLPAVQSGLLKLCLCRSRQFTYWCQGRRTCRQRHLLILLCTSFSFVRVACHNLLLHTARQHAGACCTWDHTSVSAVAASNTWMSSSVGSSGSDPPAPWALIMSKASSSCRPALRTAAFSSMHRLLAMCTSTSTSCACHQVVGRIRAAL